VQLRLKEGILMSTIAYQCPCCGAPLSFSGQSGKLECSSCGNSYETDAIEALNVPQEGSGVQFARPAETFHAQDAEEIKAYICQSCGAELITEDTTTATECPYCGSPTIFPEQIEGGVKPEQVVPFTVTQEEAQKQFHEYFKGKKLLPNIFTESRNRIDEMRKLYVPYWLFDCHAHADITYNAKKRRSERQGDWEIEHTDHYIVRRRGSLGFEHIPVDGSVKLDNKITESLEPYDLSAAVPFQPAVLAGAMADHADVDAQECESRAVERVENSISQALRDTVHGYSSVEERNRNIFTEDGKVTPVLMPVWLMTTKKEENTYTFAINGQTGKLTCDVPADGKKSFFWGAGVFAGASAVCLLILLLLDMLESGPILIALVLSLIIALIVLGVLKGQLKQAAHQTAAGNYIRQDSFDLEVEYDRFLYRTTRRRKIERNDQKN